MPDVIRPSRPKEFVTDTSRRRSRVAWPGGLFRRLFAEDSLDGGPADADTRADQLGGDGPAAEFGMRTKPANLVNGPSKGVVDAIPGRCAEEVGAMDASLGGVNPDSDGVGMQHKSLRRLLNAPAAQASDEQNLGPLAGMEIRPFSRVHGLALRAEDIALALCQGQIVRSVIAQAREAENGRRVRQETASGKMIGLGEQYGNTVEKHKRWCTHAGKYNQPFQ